jgi:hypothetical protein
MSSQLSFGTYFIHSEAELGNAVYMGTRCLIGIATIGDGCSIGRSCADTQWRATAYTVWPREWLVAAGWKIYSGANW